LAPKWIGLLALAIGRRSLRLARLSGILLRQKALSGNCDKAENESSEQ
jgi:hypothetical protein